MNRSLCHVLSAVLLFVVTGCDDNEGRLIVANPGGIEAGPGTDLFVVTTDFETGSSSLVRDDGEVFRDVEPVSPDAIARGFGQEIYVVNRLGSDNLQVLDARTVSTVRQISTGNGSNPQDVFVEGDAAWVALHERTEIEGEEINGIAVLDRFDGSLVEVIDLGRFAENEDGLPRPARIIRSGRRLLFLLQDMNRNFRVEHQGKIVFYDLDERRILDADPSTTETDALVLEFRNPQTAVPFEQGGRRLVAVSSAGSSFPQELTGGIEIIDPEAMQPTGTRIDDDDLGGNVFDIEILRPGFGFAVVQGPQEEDFPQRIATFDPSSGSVLRREVYRSGGGFLPAIQSTGDGRLAVSERARERPGVVFLDVDTFEASAPVDVGLPPFSFVVLDSGIAVDPMPGPGSTPTPADEPGASPTPTPTPDGCAVPEPPSGDLYADRVVAFLQGTGGGFGSQANTLGPPSGEGNWRGSTDVLSLGDGGSIILELTDNQIIDGPGDDFIVYENPFYVSGPDDRFIEAGIVSVSADGINFVRFEWSVDDSKPLGDPDRYENLAGVEPVLPGDGPDCIGGDRFDLADVGLPAARFVRIEDPAHLIDDPGNHAPCSNNCGFDLDAIGLLNHAPVP